MLSIKRSFKILKQKIAVLTIFEVNCCLNEHFFKREKKKNKERKGIGIHTFKGKMKFFIYLYYKNMGKYTGTKDIMEH